MRKGMKIASLVMALMMGVSAAAAEVSGEITVVSVSYTHLTLPTNSRV